MFIGGIYANNSSGLFLKRVDVYNNNASRGGGLHLQEGINTNVSNSQFLQNYATDAGGGSVFFLVSHLLNFVSA